MGSLRSDIIVGLELVSNVNVDKCSDIAEFVSIKMYESDKFETESEKAVAMYLLEDNDVISDIVCCKLDNKDLAYSAFNDPLSFRISIVSKLIAGILLTYKPTANMDAIPSWAIKQITADLESEVVDLYDCAEYLKLL